MIHLQRSRSLLGSLLCCVSEPDRQHCRSIRTASTAATTRRPGYFQRRRAKGTARGLRKRATPLGFHITTGSFCSPAYQSSREENETSFAAFNGYSRPSRFRSDRLKAFETLVRLPASFRGVSCGCRIQDKRPAYCPGWSSPRSSLRLPCRRSYRRHFCRHSVVPDRRILGESHVSLSMSAQKKMGFHFCWWQPPW